jgi:N-acylneuraminate cytidylyltransferase
MNFAYIQARGGSKRFPNKNIIEFAGKPMLVHAIDIVKRSCVFDYVCVATDDKNIAAIAQESDIAVWWREKVSDSQTDDDLAAEIVPYFSHYAIGCRIYPCIPLLRYSRFIEAETLIKYGFNAVRTVAEYEHPVERAMTIQDDGSLYYPGLDVYEMRTQQMRKKYYDPGAFLMFRIDQFKGTLAMDKTAPIVLDWCEFQDIDYPDDLEKLKMKYRGYYELV